MKARILLAAALMLGAADVPATVVVTAGSGSDCQFSTLQAAIDFVEQLGDPDKQIMLPGSDTFSDERIAIADADLMILGGVQSCSSLVVTSTQTTIDGIGGPDSPIMRIGGASHVVLANLTLMRGHAADVGGAIDFDGNGTLTLQNVAVILNSAASGGGINAVGRNGTLDIFVNQDSFISNNTALGGNGGGVQISGATSFYAISPHTSILLNHAANGAGGGIEVIAPAVATIGSSGYNGAPAVTLNNAAYGGGIGITGDGEGADYGRVRLLTFEAFNPVSVSDNIASVAGGGVYLKNINANFAPNVEFCARDFRIDENTAPEGAAIYLDWDSTLGSLDIGSDAYFNADPAGDDCNPDALPAVACSAGVACNEISGNISADADGNPANGSILLVGTSSNLTLNRTAMHANIGENLIRVLGNNDFPDAVTLSNCLTGANRMARELIRIENDDNHLSIDQCTFAPDIIDSTHVIRFDNSGGNVFVMTNTIVDEPGTLTLAQTGIGLAAANVVSNDISTLPTGDTIVAGVPNFVDIANGDYHLQQNSLGIDFAAATGGVDLDGHPRDVDLDPLNFLGPRDLGAYETQRSFACGTPDTLFCNGFEP